MTATEAISLLNKDHHIHTFRNRAGMLIGADHNRAGLIKDIKKYEDTLQLTGQLARNMGHGLVLKDKVGHLFIETNTEKINKFDPVN